MTKLSKNVKNTKIGQSGEKGLKMGYNKGFREMAKNGVFC